MAVFSGDGAGCAARLFKKYRVVIIGALHVKMLDSIGDEPILKHSTEWNRAIAAQAKKNLWSPPNFCVPAIRRKPDFASRLLGLFGQRLWFYRKARTYADTVKVSAPCTACGLCAAICLMKNISLPAQG